MKRLIILSVIFIMVLTSSNVFGKEAKFPPPNAEGRKGTLYLFQKTEAEGPWPIIYGGAWGVMRYNLWGGSFSFNFHGQKLTPYTKYTLIYYPDPWPGDGLICLGSGKANPAGNLNLNNFNFDIGTSLPASYDANWAPIYPSGAVGAKIWVVLSSDVNCGSGNESSKMIGWNPDKYLFEYNLIIFELLGD